MATLTRRWVLRPGSGEVPSPGFLTGARDLPPRLIALLTQRGLGGPDQLDAFLNPRLADLPDPYSMTGMDCAVRRLAEAVATEQPIVVHGDYDVDGITATALLVEVLGRYGARVDYRIPQRLTDGYGLSARALRDSAEAGARVIVSVDCGISAHQEARLAADLGLDLIITDHHQPPVELPPALALLNPHRPDCNFPDKNLSGVGVAFFLAAGVRRELRERGWFAGREEPDLREYLDLVALGTIADLVPLRGVNRTLVKAGLGTLQSTCRPGVVALRDVAAVREVSAGAVGFRLAPRLNAAGRLEDAATGVDLLLCRDPQQAKELADRLDSCNSERQAVEKQTLEQAVALVEHMGSAIGGHSLVLADRRWHPGVIGIVASRLVELYHRPTVLIALEKGLGKGSARSIRGFHLYRGLAACQEHLEGFGGHEFAAGVTLREDRLDDFRTAFEGEARRQLKPEDLQPVQFFDLEVCLEEIDRTLVEGLELLAPFGTGNPEPVLLLRQVRAQQAAVMAERHVRFTCRQGDVSLPAVAFGMAERRAELKGDLDLLVVPGINRWQQRERLQLLVRDWRVAQAD